MKGPAFYIPTPNTVSITGMRFDRNPSAAQSAGMELSHAAGGCSNSLYSYWLLHNVSPRRLVQLKRWNSSGENVDKN